MIDSNRCGSMSCTIRPNIWSRRRYASHAKRSFFQSVAREPTISSFTPMFRTVSIIPGIENFAPLRTETRSGFLGSPSRRFAAVSTFLRAVAICV